MHTRALLCICEWAIDSIHAGQCVRKSVVCIMYMYIYECICCRCYYCKILSVRMEIQIKIKRMWISVKLNRTEWTKCELGFQPMMIVWLTSIVIQCNPIDSVPFFFITAPDNAHMPSGWVSFNVAHRRNSFQTATNYYVQRQRRIMLSTYQSYSVG